VALQQALTSPSDFLFFEESSETRHEYVAGSVYAMSAASRDHLLITRALSGILYRELAGSSCLNLDQDTKVWIEQACAFYYPDATIACPPNFTDTRRGVIDNPSVVFEVLSPWTESFDRGAKFAAYRMLSSIQTYVLIGCESPRVEIYSCEQGEWMVAVVSGLESVALIPPVGVIVKLAELYALVDFVREE